MKHLIRNWLDENSVNLLKKLLNKKLNSIITEEIGDYSLLAMLDCENNQLLIRNTPKIQSDNEEYPCLVVTETNKRIDGYKIISINQIIRSISIIKDIVTWRYNNTKWMIESDIAIKIDLGEYNLWIISHDSLAGFIKVLRTKESIMCNNQLLDEYWSMKTDKLDSLVREEIIIV